MYGITGTAVHLMYEIIMRCVDPDDIFPARTLEAASADSTAPCAFRKTHKAHPSCTWNFGIRNFGCRLGSRLGSHVGGSSDRHSSTLYWASSCSERMSRSRFGGSGYEPPHHHHCAPRTARCGGGERLIACPAGPVVSVLQYIYSIMTLVQ